MFKSSIGIATAALLAIFASAAGAAPTSYTFDTVTRFDLGSTGQNPHNFIIGVLRNDTTPTTVTFGDSTMTRCVPVILTMIEKPGRYYLNVTVDSTFVNTGMLSCGLELRS